PRASARKLGSARASISKQELGSSQLPWTSIASVSRKQVSDQNFLPRGDIHRGRVLRAIYEYL
ncbi:hypothetical protein FRC03_001188, partial [Tulasnella sp. 419]